LYPLRSLAPAIRAQLQLSVFWHQFNPAFQSCCYGNIRVRNPSHAGRYRREPSFSSLHQNQRSVTVLAPSGPTRPGRNLIQPARPQQNPPRITPFQTTNFFPFARSFSLPPQEQARPLRMLARRPHRLPSSVSLAGMPGTPLRLSRFAYS
jgi:hypothetical protein